jgi:hypothetical protein
LVKHIIEKPSVLDERTDQFVLLGEVELPLTRPIALDQDAKGSQPESAV